MRKQLEGEISKLKERLLIERRKWKGRVVQAEAHKHIAMERQLVPKTRFGKFVMDMVLTVEKYV